MVSTEGRRGCLLLFRGGPLLVCTIKKVGCSEGGDENPGALYRQGAETAAGGIWPADLSPLSYPFLLDLFWSGNPCAGML